MYIACLLVDEFEDVESALSTFDYEGDGPPKLLGQLKANIAKNLASQFPIENFPDEIVAVIAPTECGVTLCYGFLKFKSPSRAEALALLRHRLSTADRQSRNAELLAFKTCEVMH